MPYAGGGRRARAASSSADRRSRSRSITPGSSGYDSYSSSYYSSRSSSSRSRSRSSCSTSSSESDSARGGRGHGRRRLRSASPAAEADLQPARQQSRHDSVLGSSDYVYAAGPPVLSSYGTHAAASAVSAAALPAVLGDAFLGESSGSVLGAPATPTADWPCGVCSNINMRQRSSCFRCGCHYAESLLAMPSSEVWLTHLPADCTPAVVEAAVRRAAPNCAVHHVALDAARGLMYVQFASVEAATRCLVQSHCELLLERDGDGEAGADAVRTRLSFALAAHSTHEPKTGDAADAARAAAEAAAAQQQAALVRAGVPRFLWPHTWRQPASFPTAEKHKAFLAAMSTHWDHLSDEQKRYYDAEVKKALLKTAATARVKDSSSSAAATAPPPPASSAAATPLTGQPVSSPAAAASPPAAPSPDATSGAGAGGKTSSALESLKKRLAERKNSLKKGEAGDSGKSQSAAGTPPTSAGSARALGPRWDGGSGSASGAGGAVPAPRGGSGDFPPTPPPALVTEPLTWGGFPVPPQYASLADVPRSVELPRVPMSVCERLLPPALLQVARMQFKQAR